MRNILFIIFILIPFLCKSQNAKYTVRRNAQTEDFRTPLTQDSMYISPLENAGLHMRRFSVLQYSGMALNITGAVFAGIGLTLKSDYPDHNLKNEINYRRRKIFLFTGLGLFIGGTVCNFFSVNHIFNSGRMLELAADQESINVRYNF